MIAQGTPSAPAMAIVIAPAAQFRQNCALRRARGRSFGETARQKSGTARLVAGGTARARYPLLCRLADPDVVAERVAQGAVDAVRLLGRLLGELHPSGAQLF